MPEFGLKIGMRPKLMFFDSKPVKNAVDRTTRRVLGRFGSFVKTGAKRSMRKAVQISIGSMKPKARDAWRARVKKAKEEGEPKPKRPLAPSAPGEPPRVVQGLLKKLLFFSYDRRRRSVVIGPQQTSAQGKDVPSVLEYGGTAVINGNRVHIAARPSVVPAFKKEKPKLQSMWKDSVQ